MENNENEELCKKCGGECCKSMGCAFSPNDFKGELSIELIKEIIETGIVSIDCYDGDPRKEDDNYDMNAYFLRMRDKPNKFNKGNVIDFAWFGECCLLGENGCIISFEWRPYQGKSLIPGKPRCTEMYSKRQCSIDWIPYCDMIEEVMKEYYDKNHKINKLNLSKISKEDLNKRIEKLKLLLKGE